MSKKLKATENKAKDVELKPRAEKLWAQYGRLQAHRENLGAQLNQIVQQMREIYNQIVTLEQNKGKTNAKNQ